MVGNVAALARQVLDLAASVVRYIVKNVRDTRNLTVKGSTFGDDSICSLPCQLVLIRLDHTIIVPRPCNGKRDRKQRWSCREPKLLTFSSCQCSLCMVCAYVGTICIVGMYVCLYNLVRGLREGPWGPRIDHNELQRRSASSLQQDDLATHNCKYTP